jgi:hypothetical protein
MFSNSNMDKPGKEINSNQQERDIFERLRNGETISANDPLAYKLREASYATKKLLVQMNNSSNPEEIRGLISRIREPKLMRVRQYLHHCISTTASTPKSAKMFSSISIVLF